MNGSLWIASVAMGNRLVPVTEESTYSTPFATLLHFRKETEAYQPRVLLVAPMSGHFATLLRATVKTMLVDHDVYITDWHNIRDVPLSQGRFDFGGFVDHVIKFLQVMARISCHCGLPALCSRPCCRRADGARRRRGAAAQHDLMAGPVDTRINRQRSMNLPTTADRMV